MHVSIDTARAKRTCSACGSPIVKGESHLMLMVDGGRFPKKLNMCVPCLKLWYDELTGNTKPAHGFDAMGKPSFTEAA